MTKTPKTDAELRETLSELAYKVTQQKGTEKPFTHDNTPKTSGTFNCVVCDAPLFSSKAKYDSGSGWPSFFEPITKNAVAERDDRSLLMRKRTEIICNSCEAHLGHVFNDGPKPTGQRYCMNGVAMRFVDD